MGITCYLRAVAPQTDLAVAVQTLTDMKVKPNNSVVTDLGLFPELGDAAWSDPNSGLLDLDQFWDTLFAVHWTHPAPNGFLMGGRALTKVIEGSGEWPVAYHTPQEVAEFASFLASLPDDLRQSGYDRTEAEEWGFSNWTLDDPTTMVEIHAILRSFVVDAAARKAAIIQWML